MVFCRFRTLAYWRYQLARARQFFVESPDVVIPPSPPFNRTKDHIDEIEFLLGVLRTVIWSHNNPALITCGIAGNTCPDVWIADGKSRRWVGVDIDRTFHLRSIRSNFRLCSFYSRSVRNSPADFLPRAHKPKTDDWARANGMTCIDSVETGENSD